MAAVETTNIDIVEDKGAENQVAMKNYRGRNNCW